MADETAPPHDRDSAAAVGHEGRTTAPMSEFGAREVGIGLAVLAIGLVVTFAVPAVLTL